MKNGLLLVFCLYIANSLLAQTNIYFTIGNQKYLNNKISPPALLNCNNVIKHYYRILTDNGGKVLLSFSDDILNSQGNLLIQADSLNSLLSYFQTVRLNDSLAALIYYTKELEEKNSWREQLFYSFIDFKYKNGKGRIMPGRSNVLLKTGEAKWMDVCRTYDGFYQICAQMGEKLYLFKMDDKGVNLTDSLYNPTETDFPNISKYVLDTSLTAKRTQFFLQFSHSGDFLISNSYKFIQILYPSDIPSVYEDNIIKIIYYDKISNKFIPFKTQILNSHIYLRDSVKPKKPYRSTYFLRLLSPNNKYLYCENKIIQKYPYNFNIATDKSQYLQFDIQQRKYVDSITTITNYPYSDYLSPFSHKLNLFTLENYNQPKLYEIDPNVAGLNNGNLKFLKSYNQNISIWNFMDIYEYVKIDIKTAYDCQAIVDLQNISDLSGGIDKFKWVITNQKGTRDTLYGFDQKVTYTKNGKYGFKVYASSPLNGGYGEWYYDTIEINIPTKPIANFRADDTVICRYLPLKFKNLSYAQEVNPSTQEKYVWTFGDGITSSEKEPTHIYTQPGTYTVTLFYSNGYCDSTITKNQYIRVVDAPKPGFSTAARQGCVPFTATIHDTVSLNVTKKEYYFSDSMQWQPVSGTSINHTFYKPGHYWAVQKLYGYTGCIIRTDSIQFYISKGIIPKDSIAITLASFDTLNHLHLEWESHPAATAYNVYRSEDGNWFSLMTNTTQTKATDKGVFKKPTCYKVIAIDSCGKFSSARNLVKPQWLIGKRLPANEAAILTYEPDKGLGISQTIELEWTYQHAINLTLGETNPGNPYHDDNFANHGFLKKCYRLRATHNTNTVYSNYLCLNYEPQIFVPNSFSPNGDGLNETFAPAMMGIESYTLKIFNCWGEMVYSGSIPWNGQINGKTAEAEIYFYSIHATRNDSQIQFFKGTIHLMR